MQYTFNMQSTLFAMHEDAALARAHTLPGTHGPPLTEEVLFKQTLALGNNFSFRTLSFGSYGSLLSLRSGASSLLAIP